MFFYYHGQILCPNYEYTHPSLFVSGSVPIALTSYVCVGYTLSGPSTKRAAAKILPGLRFSLPFKIWSCFWLLNTLFLPPNSLLRQIPEKSKPPSNLKWQHLGNSTATHKYRCRCCIIISILGQSGAFQSFLAKLGQDLHVRTAFVASAKLRINFFSPSIWTRTRHVQQ